MIPILEWNGDAEGMSKAAKTVPFSPMRGESVTFRNTLDSPFRLSWYDYARAVTQTFLIWNLPLSPLSPSLPPLPQA